MLSCELPAWILLCPKGKLSNTNTLVLTRVISINALSSGYQEGSSGVVCIVNFIDLVSGVVTFVVFRFLRKSLC